MPDRPSEFFHSGSGDNVYKKTENNYISEVGRILNEIHYSPALHLLPEPSCPISDGGCGGRVEMLKRVWLRESNNGMPRSDLGRMVAPPNQPVLIVQIPDEPEHRSSPPPPPDLTGEQERFDQAFANRGRSIAFKTTILGIVCLAILAALVHESNPNRDNPAPVFAAIAVGCAVLTVFGFAWFKIASASITRERADLFAARRRDYEALLEALEIKATRNREAYETDLQRYQSEKDRFDTEILIYQEVYKIWLDSWHCTRCGRKWRDTEIDRAKIPDVQGGLPPV